MAPRIKRKRGIRTSKMVKEFEPIKIFLSYDDKDESLKDNLTKHLSILKNQGHITIWNHSNIQAGEETTQAGNKNLNEADIILLLMSSDFIASDYYDTEMKEALKRHETENTRVIPILLRPFHLSDELFNNLKVLPDNGKPVTQWTSEDGAFANIVQNIKEVVNNL